MLDDNPHDTPHDMPFWRRFWHAIQFSPRKRLQRLIHSLSRSGAVDEVSAQILQKALHLSEMKVRDIMVTRAQVSLLYTTESYEEIFSKIRETAYSRYPVLDEEDRLLGVFLVKDLWCHFASLQSNGSGNLFAGLFSQFVLKDFIRPVLSVSESKRVSALLREMRGEGYHLATVLDEQGLLSGVVTLEDLLEEVVGEIQDEHDQEEEYVHPLSKESGVFALDPSMPISLFNQHFSTRLEESQGTIGGWLLNETEYLPKAGERFTFPPHEFVVAEATERRIEKLLIRVLQ